ncbi:MAG: nucleotide exchange factor GrpE [Candidatus Moraniibacteriota bacterium]
MTEEKKKKIEKEKEEVLTPEEPQEREAEEEKTEGWEEKAGEYLESWKRTQADFENYKKRIQSDRSELSAHLTQAVISDLIPILDNFHAAVTHVPEGEKGSPWVTGITYIEKQFEDVLRTYGVKLIEVNPGDPFDPSQHEAISSQQETENSKREETEGTPPVEVRGHIIDKVVQKGYRIGDKVVRAAKVTVR